MLRNALLSTFAIVTLAPAGAGLRAGEDGVVTRRYDLRRIIARVPDRPSPPVFFRSGEGWRESAESLDIDILGVREGAAVPNRLIDSEEVVDFLSDHLLRYALVEPDIRCPMDVARGTLTVTAPPRAQEEVARFLGYLEYLASRWIRVECLAVPPELLDALAPAWRTSGPALPGDTFDRALLDPRVRLFTAMVRAGQRVFAGTKEIRPLLCDQEVNQTGVSPVNNPVIEDCGGGDLVEILALIAPDGKTIVLEMAAAAAVVRTEKTNIGEDWGDLELPIADGTRILTAVTVSPGEAIVFAGVEGRGKRVMLVRAMHASPAGAEPPAPGAADDVFRVYDISTIIRHPRDLRGPALPTFGEEDPGGGFDFEGDEEEEGGVDPLALVEAIQRFFGDEAFIEGEVSLKYSRACLFVSAPKAFHEKLEAFLAAEVRARIALVSVDLELIDAPRQILGPLAGETERGLVLKPGWRKVLESVERATRWHYRIAGLPGETHNVTDATIRSLVVDSEQVSGGTGWALITVSDPVVRTWEEGFDLIVRADLFEGATDVILKVDGIDAGDCEIRPATARYVAPQGAATGVGGGDAKHPAPPGRTKGAEFEIKEMHLQLPQQTARALNLSLDVPVDRDILLDVRAEEGERAWLLVGRVRVARPGESL
ncbi:MAG: hypothetical protein JXP34_26685 [Planctomycetes bacterium]|nr:hypothetical protein [Planctomycetota bacterium]